MAETSLASPSSLSFHCNYNRKASFLYWKWQEKLGGGACIAISYQQSAVGKERFASKPVEKGYDEERKGLATERNSRMTP